MRIRHRGAPSDAEAPALERRRRRRLRPALPIAALLLLGVATAGWVERGGGDTRAARTVTATPSQSPGQFSAKIAAGGGPAAQGGTFETKYGPLSPSDRDFLVKVRLAGLWEKPSGTMGLKRSANPLVQEASKHLINGHTDLDAKDIAIAQMFGVKLPTQPNELQQEWMGEMTDASSEQGFGAVWVNRLRAAHGVVYGLLAAVRANTRNAMIRAFAAYCMNTVLDHMTVLEKTGQVKWDDMESPPIPDGLSEREAAILPTKYGPLSAADRDFLTKVHLASLWQKPSGQEAAQKSQNTLVKAAGEKLVTNFSDLDSKAVAIGQMFNMTMPNRPTPQQQGFINEMANASSPQAFDTIFANRTRAASGAMFQMLAVERTGSKNIMVRTFAEYALKKVLDDMQTLEQTKLVAFEKLPANPQPVAVGLRERRPNWIIVGLILAGMVAISMVVMRELYGRK